MLTYIDVYKRQALGNIIAQMLKSGEFTSLQNARDAIKKSFEIKLFQ